VTCNARSSNTPIKPLHHRLHPLGARPSPIDHGDPDSTMASAKRYEIAVHPEPSKTP
jgi:hypothetical protein